MMQEKLFSNFLEKVISHTINWVETLLSVCNLKVDSNAL